MIHPNNNNNTNSPVLKSQHFHSLLNNNQQQQLSMEHPTNQSSIIQNQTINSRQQQMPLPSPPANQMMRNFITQQQQHSPTITSNSIRDNQQPSTSTITTTPVNPLHSPSYLSTISRDSPSVPALGSPYNTVDTIVGPSDHYGVHHNQQFSSTNTNNNNAPIVNDPKTFDNNNHISAMNNLNPLLSQKETKVCVIVDSRTPVIFTIPQSPTRITLADLKSALPAIDQPNYKYFFKSSDSEFGIVKEEISDDDSILPTFKNRVVAWIVTPGRIGDELASSKMTTTNRSDTDTCNLTYSNTSYDDNGSSSLITTDMETTSYFTETDDDSISCSNYSETTCDTFISQRRNSNNNNLNSINNNRQAYNNKRTSPIYPSNHHHYNNHHHNRHTNNNSPYRYGNANGGSSNQHNRKIFDKLSTSSSSSTSSTNSSSASHSDATAVHCLTVHLVLTNENFLGLHIYANAINGSDEGIYVDGVTEKSAVALDGRIEPGDKLIQVNDVNLEELSNEEAVKVLKDAVIKRGSLKLVVAKFVETNNESKVGIVSARDEIHPIDTAAWVEAHANAITSIQPDENHDHANSATSSPSFGSRAQDTDFIRPSSANMARFNSGLKLSKTATDIKEIIHHMKMPEIGLNIKDREWLKITIPKAFLGSDLATWLERNVYGFSSNKEAKKFAARMLKEGYIRDPISKKSFSSKSYYTFVV